MSEPLTVQAPATDRLAVSAVLNATVIRLPWTKVPEPGLTETLLNDGPGLEAEEVGSPALAPAAAAVVVAGVCTAAAAEAVCVPHAPFSTRGNPSSTYMQTSSPVFLSAIEMPDIF